MSTAGVAVAARSYLVRPLLVKLDRCLMAHGVEGRVPLLDVKLAGFAFGALPQN